MSEYVPIAFRREVRERASGCCEYCLVHEDDCLLPHEPDHIIATKHRGDSWPAHFSIDDDGVIGALTDVGRVTVSLLRMNRPEQLELRRTLLIYELYPRNDINT